MPDRIFALSFLSAATSVVGFIVAYVAARTTRNTYRYTLAESVRGAPEKLLLAKGKPVAPAKANSFAPWIPAIVAAICVLLIAINNAKPHPALQPKAASFATNSFSFRAALNEGSQSLDDEGNVILTLDVSRMPRACSRLRVAPSIGAPSFDVGSVATDYVSGCVSRWRWVLAPRRQGVSSISIAVTVTDPHGGSSGSSTVLRIETIHLTSFREMLSLLIFPVLATVLGQAAGTKT